MDTAEVTRYGYTAWITRAMREDAPLVDAYLAHELARAAGLERRMVDGSLTVEWRSRETDPMAIADLPDDDPRRQMWQRGDLFFAVCEARFTVA